MGEKGQEKTHKSTGEKMTSTPSTRISAMEPEFCPRRKPASPQFLAPTVFGGSRDATFVQTTTV